MNTKSILIGVGVLALIGGVIYFATKDKEETTSSASGCGCM